MTDQAPNPSPSEQEPSPYSQLEAILEHEAPGSPLILAIGDEVALGLAERDGDEITAAIIRNDIRKARLGPDAGKVQTDASWILNYYKNSDTFGGSKHPLAELDIDLDRINRRKSREANPL